jgi:hypothetical protein
MRSAPACTAVEWARLADAALAGPVSRSGGRGGLSEAGKPGSPRQTLESEQSELPSARAAAARFPLCVRPTARDQLAVPAQQRVRLDREVRPSRPRHRATKRSEQRPIGTSQPRSATMTAQHRQLMTQEEDLQLLSSDAAVPATTPARTDSAPSDTRASRATNLPRPRQAAGHPHLFAMRVVGANLNARGT